MAIETGNATPAPNAPVNSRAPRYFGGNNLILSGVLIALIAVAGYAIFNSWDAMSPGNLGTEPTTKTDGEAAPKTNAQ